MACKGKNLPRVLIICGARTREVHIPVSGGQSGGGLSIQSFAANAAVRTLSLFFFRMGGEEICR